MPPASKSPVAALAPLRDRIAAVLSSYWGYSELRPMQFDAVQAALDNRDALVVLPTGGGKSLCYQLPPLLRQPSQPSLCVVVSPLIALMKDQVDGMKLAGYPAAALHSGIDYEDSVAIRREVETGTIKLLLVSPERLLNDGFLAWLVRLGQSSRSGQRGVANIAIDEAHCISQWGHDFRPEYRRLLELREALPGTPIQAFTATATPRVREDIIAQLHMRDPAVLVGTFDRPNLTYRIVPRAGSGIDQIEEILRRHQGATGSNDSGDAAIVYCMSRKQTEEVASELTSRGLKSQAYHAGMDARARHRVQEAFSTERLNIVVATVAFGMGIDRGDVRCVIHASSPKSVEAYQQETGRAGRDGLPSECVLLYSGSDAAKWSSLVDRSAAESDVHVPFEVIQAQKELIQQMQRLAAGTRCRHRVLSEYFGQEYTPPTVSAETEAAASTSCNACDVCLGELEAEADSTTIARKIISCVARLRGTRNDSFGAVYVADVLRGAGLGKIIERQHHLLSTFGLLRDLGKDTIVNHINQLVDMGVLGRATGDYPTIILTGDSGAVLRGERDITLFRAKSSDAVAGADRKRRRNDATGASASPLDPQERALFEHLRQLRRSIAEEMNVPPYLVFGDAALEDMCRARPSTLDAFARVRGVGRSKLEQFGDRFIAAIVEHCQGAGLPTDIAGAPTSRPFLGESNAPTRPMTDIRKAAAALFDRGMSIDDATAKLARAKSTTVQYLVEYIVREKPATIAPWVPDAEYTRIRTLAISMNEDRIKPIFEQLNGSSEHESIRITLAHMRSQGLTVPYNR